MMKGFILTAIASILFLLLIDATLQYSKTSSSYSERISELIVSQKVEYTFDDIIDGITNITSVSITQQQGDLIFQDSLPANGITGKLNRYESFMRSYYLTPDLQATFLDSNNNQINLNQLSSEIDAQPFNLNYSYSDFSKNNLFVQIPYSQTSVLTCIGCSVWYNISVINTTMNFTNPVWNPAPAGCVQGNLGCIRFYLILNDSSGAVYKSSYSVFDMTQTAGHLNLTSNDGNCWIDMRFGNVTGQSYLINMQIHNCQTQTSFWFSFSTSDFWMQFPTKLKVIDVNYNTSKVANIPPIMTKLVK